VDGVASLRTAIPGCLIYVRHRTDCISVQQQTVSLELEVCEFSRHQASPFPRLGTLANGLGPASWQPLWRVVLRDPRR
jgi:hypothetical protein